MVTVLDISTQSCNIISHTCFCQGFSNPLQVLHFWSLWYKRDKEIGTNHHIYSKWQNNLNDYWDDSNWQSWATQFEEFQDEHPMNIPWTQVKIHKSNLCLSHRIPDWSFANAGHSAKRDFPERLERTDRREPSMFAGIARWDPRGKRCRKTGACGFRRCNTDLHRLEWLASCSWSWKWDTLADHLPTGKTRVGRGFHGCPTSAVGQTAGWPEHMGHLHSSARFHLSVVK